MKIKLLIPAFSLIIIILAAAGVYRAFLYQDKLVLKVPAAQLSSEGVDAAVQVMEDILDANVPLATETMGLQEISPVVGDSVKALRLTAAPVKWRLFGDTYAIAWAYNGMVPGPLIRVTSGDKVRIIVTNDLSEPTTIHWHGIHVPNDMDGIPDVTLNTWMATGLF